jgi:hypothetical protein
LEFLNGKINGFLDMIPKAQTTEVEKKLDK